MNIQTWQAINVEKIALVVHWLVTTRQLALIGMTIIKQVSHKAIPKHVKGCNQILVGSLAHIKMINNDNLALFCCIAVYNQTSLWSMR